MKAEKRDKTTLDAIGRRLIERDVVAAQDIDRVVSDPHLFSRISARVEDSAPRPVRSPLFIRYAAATAGMATIALAVFAAVVSLRSVQGGSQVIEVQAPADVPATARPANLPPLKAGSNPSPGRAIFEDTEAPIQRASATKATYSKPAARRETPSVPDEAPEFIPVAYAGDPRETAGGHIVRVDMPRSSLFALGVNVPLENDSDTVKADLLIGADGVTRAIRVVK